MLWYRLGSRSVILEPVQWAHKTTLEVNPEMKANTRPGSMPMSVHEPPFLGTKTLGLPVVMMLSRERCDYWRGWLLLPCLLDVQKKQRKKCLVVLLERFSRRYMSPRPGLSAVALWKIEFLLPWDNPTEIGWTRPKSARSLPVFSCSQPPLALALELWPGSVGSCLWAEDYWDGVAVRFFRPPSSGMRWR